MAENIGFILGALFFLVLIFGGALMEFIETRRKQKFAHEQEMARIAAGKRPRRVALTEDVEKEGP